MRGAPAGRPRPGGRPSRRAPAGACGWGYFSEAGGRRPSAPRTLAPRAARAARVACLPLLGVFPSLPDTLVLEAVPGARLLDEVLIDRGVEHGARLGHALAVEHVELRLAERRRQLVLHDLHLGSHADRLRPLLDRVLPPD